MFEKFGEFDSAEEINRAAAAQKAEGDEEALVLLATENGIDREDAEDYMDGVIAELTTPALAASGKLRVEAKELKIEGILLDWVHEIEDAMLGNEKLQIAIRKKGKDLAGYIAMLVEEGYKSRAEVDKAIIDRCDKVKKVVGSHPLSIGCPTRAQRKKMMLEYYMGVKA